MDKYSVKNKAYRTIFVSTMYISSIVLTGYLSMFYVLRWFGEFNFLDILLESSLFIGLQVVNLSIIMILPLMGMRKMKKSMFHVSVLMLTILLLVFFCANSLVIDKNWSLIIYIFIYMFLFLFDLYCIKKTNIIIFLVLFLFINYVMFLSNYTFLRETFYHFQSETNNYIVVINIRNIQYSVGYEIKKAKGANKLVFSRDDCVVVNSLDTITSRIHIP